MSVNRHGQPAGGEGLERGVVGLSLALLIGVTIGTATSIGQAHLNLPWSSLVNSASPWLLGGFFAGALQQRRRTGIAAGLLACVSEVVAYYAVTEVRGYPASNGEIAFWIVTAVIGGPLFGWGGWAWRHGPARLRPLGACLVGATFLAEAIGTYDLRLHYHSTVILYLLIGVALTVLVTLTSGALRRHPTAITTSTLAAFIVGLLVYWLGLSVLAGSSFSA
jgi:hypothetical protein